MGNTPSVLSKLYTLILPAQSGKTRKVEERIAEFKEICGNDGVYSIDILISANNQLLVHQTRARIKKDLGSADSSPSASDDDSSYDGEEKEPEDSDAVIKGEIFSWTYGKKTNIPFDSLKDKILLRDIELVLMCANKRRMTYLARMLTALVTHKRFKRSPFPIKIWIDEADATINIWRQFQEIIDLPAIKQVTLVSATFGSVLKRFDRLRVIPFQITYPPCYRRLKDFHQVIVELGANPPAVEFILHVLALNPALCAPGQRLFTPGAYTKASHEEIADALAARGFATIIINGETKQLRIPGSPPIDLRPSLSCADPEMLPPEFNQTLAQLYYDNNLKRFPMAITGYLCVQRGVTFQCAPTETHNGFTFTNGIIPPNSNKAEAYQTTLRCGGNTGDFPDYVLPTIYTNAKTFAGITEQEEIAVNLPKIVYDEGLEFVDKHVFDRAAGKHTTWMVTPSFGTREAAVVWSTTHIVWSHRDLAGHCKRDGTPDPITKLRNVTAFGPKGFSDKSASTHMSTRDHRGENAELIISRDELIASGDLSRWGEGIPCVPVVSATGLQYVIVYKKQWGIE